jgi:hypothetical protein
MNAQNKEPSNKKPLNKTPFIIAFALILFVLGMFTGPAVLPKVANAFSAQASDCTAPEPFQVLTGGNYVTLDNGKTVYLDSGYYLIDDPNMPSLAIIDISTLVEFSQNCKPPANHITVMGRFSGTMPVAKADGTGSTQVKVSFFVANVPKTSDALTSLLSPTQPAASK